ncbi:MAG: DUF1772 domain-containing protein [Sneathiella sp.]|nr:DUF1772 domain-containing protein [Sneathiella sp.]
MTSTWFFVLLEISVIACGLVSGVFLTFSDFVMRSLDGAKTSAGVEVMQVINREVFRTVFMVLLLSMSALSPFLMGYAYFRIAGPTSALIMIGGALYFAGVFGVSLIFNVPMNNHLDTKGHSSPEAATYWTTIYFPQWTFWNYVRALASAGSAICFLIAGVWLAQGG